MWRLLDNNRRLHRRRQIALEDAVLVSMFLRERQSDLYPVWDQASNKRMPANGRLMLVKWMFSAGKNCLLQSSTIGLAINYFDRIASQANISLKNVHVLASVCIHIARKMREVGGDGMEDIETEEIDMNANLELYAVNILNWRLVVPTSHCFLGMFFDRFWIPARNRWRAIEYLETLISCKFALQVLKFHLSEYSKLSNH